MKRAVAYVGLVLAWLALAFSVGIAVSAPIVLAIHYHEVILWRVALLFILPIAVGLGCVLMIRWARSVLGKPGGSRAGRIALGIIVIVWGVGSMSAADQGSTAAARDGSLIAGAAMALFGAALIFEAAWWHRASKGTAAPLPDAPTGTPDSAPDVALPEPPPGR